MKLNIVYPSNSLGMTPAMHAIAVIRAAITGFADSPPPMFLRNVLMLEINFLSAEQRDVLLPKLYSIIVSLWSALPKSFASEILEKKWKERFVLMFEGGPPAPRNSFWAELASSVEACAELIAHVSDSPLGLPREDLARAGFQSRRLWLDMAAEQERHIQMKIVNNLIQYVYCAYIQYLTSTHPL